MDIRSARPPKGSMPPRNVAPEKPEMRSVDVDEKNEITENEIETYGGDLVVAGYMEYLEKNGISESDIGDILEALIANGSVSWSFELLERIPVEFVLRPAWVDDYITATFDRLAGETARVSNLRCHNIIAECNLAASLARYGETSFVVRSEDDMDAARERVRKMPFIIQNALVRKLAVFDRVMAVAMSDWAVKNFMKPRQEKSAQS